MYGTKAHETTLAGLLTRARGSRVLAAAAISGGLLAAAATAAAGQAPAGKPLAGAAVAGSPLVAAPAKAVPAAHVAGGAMGAKLGASADLAAATGIAGYTIVNSGTLSSPAGAQVHGQATCPVGRFLVGGGAAIASLATGANVNDSYPVSGTWEADVNNATSSDTTFTVYAICAKQPHAYTIAQATGFDNPPDLQAGGTVACPATLVPTGGGVYSTSLLTSVNVNSTYPLATHPGKGWHVDENNGSGLDFQFNVQTVCTNHLRNYKIVVASGYSNPAGAQSRGTATCPVGLPVGGGVYSSSGSPAVNVNVSAPEGNQWVVYQNNASGLDASFNVYAICAGS
jgi:hypothetical protein